MSEQPQPTRFLAWEACHNARDTGGYPTHSGRQIRWQTLVRADNLHKLTLAGQAALRDYGVRTVIDLRLAHEVEKTPNPFAVQQNLPDTPIYLNLPLHDPAANAAMDVAPSMMHEYIIILEQSKPHVAKRNSGRSLRHGRRCRRCPLSRRKRSHRHRRGPPSLHSRRPP